MKLCLVSGKRSYETKADCLAANDELPQSPRAYECSCGHWHLTRAGAIDWIADAENPPRTGPVGACYFCGGAGEAGGCVCSACRGTGGRAEAAAA